MSSKAHLQLATFVEAPVQSDLSLARGSDTPRLIAGFRPPAEALVATLTTTWLYLYIEIGLLITMKTFFPEHTTM